MQYSYWLNNIQVPTGYYYYPYTYSTVNPSPLPINPVISPRYYAGPSTCYPVYSSRTNITMDYSSSDDDENFYSTERGLSIYHFLHDVDLRYQSGISNELYMDLNRQRRVKMQRIGKKLLKGAAKTAFGLTAAVLTQEMFPFG